MSKEFVDNKALFDRIIVLNEFFFQKYKELIRDELIRDFSTEKVKKVTYGKWVESITLGEPSTWRCSECGGSPYKPDDRIDVQSYLYCPFCGSEMNEVITEE